jgi:hypothetical protein
MRAASPPQGQHFPSRIAFAICMSKLHIDERSRCCIA